MNIDELREYLDLEEDGGLEYFENLADLLEFEEDIDFNVFYEILKVSNIEALRDLIDNYFEDLGEHLPPDAAEVYAIFSTLKLSLIGIIDTKDEDDLFRSMAEELYRFRQWYTVDSQVVCTNETNGKEMVMPICESIILHRSEAFGPAKYFYDFSRCLDYTVDEYVVSFSSLIEEEEE